MMKNLISQIESNSYWIFVLIPIPVIIFFWSEKIAFAQTDDDPEPKVQEVSGLLGEESIAVYRLADLKEGQQLYVRMENSTGNLDPFLALFPGETRAQDVAGKFSDAIDQVIAEGGDPLAILPAIFDSLTLIWNDDIPGTLTAGFEYTIPADGNYLLATSDAPFTDSFGSYRLQIGINEPAVLEGSARPRTRLPAGSQRADAHIFVSPGKPERQA